MKAFAHKGARDFDDGNWLHLIHDGSTKKRLEYCQDKDGNLRHLRAIQGHSGGIPITPELMKYTRLFHTIGRSTFIREEVRWIFQSILVQWNNTRKKEEDKARQAVSLWTPLNAFWQGPGRGEASFRLHSFSQKFHLKPNGNATKMLCIG